MSFVANFPHSPPEKERRKSLENWQSYRSSSVYYFLGTQCMLTDL